MYWRLEADNCRTGGLLKDNYRTGGPFVQHKASLAEWLLHGFEHGHLAGLVDVGRNGGLGCASSLAVREYTETRRRRGHRCSRRVGL